MTIKIELANDLASALLGFVAKADFLSPEEGRELADYLAQQAKGTEPHEKLFLEQAATFIRAVAVVDCNGKPLT